MLVLLGYLLGLALLSFLIRKQRAQLRSFLIVGYNYLFAIPLYFIAQMPEGPMTPGAVVNLLVKCAYAAPKALAFGAETRMFDDPAITLLFFIMSMYTIRAVLLAFFRRVFTDTAMRLRMLGKGEIFAVCGELEDAKSLIRDIRAKNPKAAVLFVPQRDSDHEAKVDALVEIRPWKEFLRPGRRYHIILLPDKKDNNLRQLDDLEKLGETLPGLRVTAFLDNDMLRYEDLRYPHLDAYLVSREQLLIRSFLNDNLPLRTLMQRGEGSFESGIYRPDRPFSLCILGFGALSREFLLSTWENAAFQTGAADGHGLDALIIDRDLTSRRAPFFLDTPQLAKEQSFVWLDAAPDSEASFQALQSQLRKFHQILIASNDTRLNLDLAMRLMRLFRRSGMEHDHPQLVVALFEKVDGSIEFLSKEAGGIFLQSNNSQFTYGELILRESDQKAGELHSRYSKNSLFGANWNEIGTYLQNSNRAVVWDIPNKLLLAGDLEGLSKEERERRYWLLAQYEHLRWNAFQYTHGWSSLPLEELTPEEIAQKRTKRAAQKLHACLTTWDQLDALPQARPGLLKYYDYENVLHLFEPDTPV